MGARPTGNGLAPRSPILGPPRRMEPSGRPAHCHANSGGARCDKAVSAAANRNLPNLDDLIDRMRAENTSQRRAGHGELRPLDIAEAHRLATAAVWPLWNAVEGPQNRTDDPRDRYFDRFTSGLTPQEAARMKSVEGLFGDLRTFINAGPAPGPVNLRALVDATSRVRSIVSCDLPIRYRAELWVNEGNGRWRKRRDGERSTAATT